MKCRNCPALLEEALEEVTLVDVQRALPITGIQYVHEDGELSLEYDYDNVREEDQDSELICYQCGSCGAEYSTDIIKRVFKWGG